MKLNIVILEDDSILANQLIDYLENWAEITGNQFDIFKYTNCDSFLKEYITKDFQVCFFDIQLSNNNGAPTGIDVAKILRKNGFSGEIIFVTNYREYVFEGYDVNAFHFLLKPIEIKSLHKILSSLEKKYADKYYILMTNNLKIRIPFYKIISINSARHNIIITTQEEVYESRKNLSDIEKELPKNFVRCHRSCIVNLDHIERIDNSNILLSNHTHQAIRRTYLSNLQNQYVMHLTT